MTVAFQIYTAKNLKSSLNIIVGMFQEVFDTKQIVLFPKYAGNPY